MHRTPHLQALHATALLAALFATACSAQRPLPPSEARWLRMEVVDSDTGQILPQHRNRRAAWVAGEPGQAYALRVSNLSAERLLVVLSIDGVNVISGETASALQSGYVLEPYGNATIDGWRKSMSDVAAFRFSDLPDSYAAQTGRPLDVGVIGAAVFRERPQPTLMPWPAPPVAAAESKALQDSARAEAPERRSRNDIQSPSPVAQGLGTAHGERRWSPTSHTEFERASSLPHEVIALRYDDRAGLLARGIIRQDRPWLAREPRPFPNGFVPDPPR